MIYLLVTGQHSTHTRTERFMHKHIDTLIIISCTSGAIDTTPDTSYLSGANSAHTQPHTYTHTTDTQTRNASRITKQYLLKFKSNSNQFSSCTSSCCSSHTVWPQGDGKSSTVHARWLKIFILNFIFAVVKKEIVREMEIRGSKELKKKWSGWYEGEGN